VLSSEQTTPFWREAVVDDKVLEAQQWVNATYGGVVGYQRCPEDGNTGWLTMWSLTMRRSRAEAG
jgi:hypothetical protein